MGGNLSELTLAPEYRSDNSDLVNDFYVPCLERSILYRRAVGYFTSHSLAIAAQGISALLAAGGRMRLVASPYFNAEDVEALRNGHIARDNAVERAMLRALDHISDQLVEDRLSALAWLIAESRLEIRVAVPQVTAQRPRRGIYHEKLGLFSDGSINTVAFTGSANETIGGLLENFEAIDVFTSWDDHNGRVARKESHFERLWQNQTEGLAVEEFPEAVRKRLINFRKPDRTSAAPGPIKWRHQDEAIAAFLATGRGILEMATGTGKTRTALSICARLSAEKEIDSIIVAADGLDLLDQWNAHILAALPQLRARFFVHRHYGRHHDRDRFIANPRNRILLASRQALAPALRGLPSDRAKRTLLVHDEVHRLGSAATRTSLEGLSDSIRYRLGLSATPEREYDEDGSTFIKDHVGPVVFQFGLEDAIRRGILAPFTYSPLEYEVDDEDRRRLRDVYKRAEARARAGKPMSKEEIWIELSRVHKTSPTKLPLFESFLLRNRGLLERCIIFVETKEYGEEVLRIVHRYRHDFHTYYSGEDSETLRRFAHGEIQCLITCHRLSEGVDIKSIASVVLFSSSRAPLETIQRMGRCLRTDPSNPSKRAWVVDFIRNDSKQEEKEMPNADATRREWLTILSAIQPEVVCHLTDE